VAGTDEIKFWVMSCGSHALALEPESLQDEIRAEAESLLNRYEKKRRKRREAADGVNLKFLRILFFRTSLSKRYLLSSFHQSNQQETILAH